MSVFNQGEIGYTGGANEQVFRKNVSAATESLQVSIPKDELQLGEFNLFSDIRF